MGQVGNVLAATWRSVESDLLFSSVWTGFGAIRDRFERSDLNSDDMALPFKIPRFEPLVQLL